MHFTLSGPLPSRVQKNWIAATRPMKFAKLSLNPTWPGTKRYRWASSCSTVVTISTSSVCSVVESTGSLNHPSVLNAAVGRTYVS